MSQSRKASALETVTNTGVGYLVALATQVAVFPAFGIDTGLGENMGIAAVFTVVSLVRGYLMRRVFNHLTGRGQ